MNRVKLARVMLAALLVVVLPLEQAHCACVAMAQRGSQAMAPAAAPACHASCCASHAAGHGTRHTSSAPSTRGCPCEKLTATELPVVLAVAHADAPAPVFAPLPIADPIEPRAASIATVPALDVGTPPPLIDPGAHGLRAPPLFS